MKPLPVNILHILEVLLEMYTAKAPDVLVCEAFANAVDVFLDNKTKNPKIEVTLEKESEDVGYITFHNNGTPMTRPQFDKYHEVGVKSKTKGRGIGFAGVGAKIFLASKLGGEIFTITGENNEKFLASRMVRQSDNVLMDEITDLSKIFGNKKYQHKYGTTYRVKINGWAYRYFKNTVPVSGIVQYWWNYALLKKQFTVTVDGKEVKPYDPQGEKFQKSFTWKNYKINCYYWISTGEIPEERQHIVYAVYGKRIQKDPLRTPVNFKEDYSHRVFCLADVTHLAGHIKPDKEHFEGNQFTNGTRNEVEKRFIEFLNEHGLLGKDLSRHDSAEIVNEATKELDKLLSTIEFKELDPFLTYRKRMLPTPDQNGDIPITETTGEGPVGGDEPVEEPGEGGGAGDGEGRSFVEDKDGADPGKRKERKSRGLRIMLTWDHPENEKEGWVDALNGAIVINVLHPFYQTMVESDRFGRLEKFNTNRILIEAIIRHKSDELDWTPQKTLDVQNSLLHKMWRG